MTVRKHEIAKSTETHDRYGKAVVKPSLRLQVWTVILSWKQE